MHSAAFAVLDRFFNHKESRLYWIVCGHNVSHEIQPKLGQYDLILLATGGPSHRCFSPDGNILE